MIGNMKYRGTIMKQVATSNGRGGIHYKDHSLGLFWFALTDLGAEKIARLNRLDERVKTEIHLRFDADIDTDCYLIYENKRFDFLNVQRLGNDQFLKVDSTGGELLAK